MADETKVYCYDRPACDNSALWGALMSRNNESPAELMSLMNNCNMNNNPFIWLVFLMLFRNGLWNGGDGVGENYNSRQISALQDTVNSNHNNSIALEAIRGNGNAISQLASTFNTDFNTISTAICGVKSAIEKVGGDVNYSSERVINAINLGDANLMSKMQDCCCQQKQLILEQGYQSQLATERQTNTLGSQMASNFASAQLQACKDNGSVLSRIDQLANGITQGFSATAYESAKHTSDIIAAGNANTQRIIDTMQNHWALEQSQALQDAKAEISQLKQSQYLADVIKANACNCNNGCGC